MSKEAQNITGRELVVDNFAGGGGASTGIERALGRPIDIAINHDPEAIAMHKANHPRTRHLCESVFAVSPLEITGGQPVGLAWFSPDCTHHSKAKGGKPRSAKRRGLAWVVIRWASRVRPRVIMLENVEEFEDWGPLLADGNPCPERRGQTFGQWVHQLERCGYRVEWRSLRACDYGAPTIRKRLVLIARRDGMPIVWPQPTHGAGGLPYRTAAECIDWNIPCPSIFTRKKPLADNTCRRIAAGLARFVINNPHPFMAPASAGTGTGRHEQAAAFMAKHYGGVIGHRLDQPLGTVTTRDHHSPVTVTLGAQSNPTAAAFLVKYYGSERDGVPLTEPMHTIPTRDRFGLVYAHGQTLHITDIGMRMLQPHELAAAQGFPREYLLAAEIGGRRLNKTAQTRMIGNSVCPDLAAAVVAANFTHEADLQHAAA